MGHSSGEGGGPGRGNGTVQWGFGSACGAGDTGSILAAVRRGSTDESWSSLPPPPEP